LLICNKLITYKCQNHMINVAKTCWKSMKIEMIIPHEKEGEM
jgi:hypothetical protein